jgi:hypothetical protein
MIYALIIAVVVVVVYWKTLKYGYAIDDFDLAKASVNKPIENKLWKRVYLAWRGQLYKDPRLPHRITFTLHLANSLLVYYAFGHNWISFLTALLFSINPAGTQGSIWMAGKGYSSAVTLILLMISFKYLTPAFYYLSTFCGMISSLPAPALFLGTPLWFWIFLIPLMVWVNRKVIITSLQNKYKMTPKITRTPSLKRSILYFKTLGYYFTLGLFPMRLGVYHDYGYVFGLTEKETKDCLKPDWYSFLGLGVVVTLIFSLIYFRYSPTTFGLFGFVVLISPWCNFPITIQQFVAERYLYLPLVFLMYFLVNVIVLVDKIILLPFVK